MAEQFDDLRQQLLAVQSQLAFQEHTVQALDDALALQQREIMQLRRQLELLKQRQDEQAVRQDADEAGVPADERPPHY